MHEKELEEWQDLIYPAAFIYDERLKNGLEEVEEQEESSFDGTMLGEDGYMGIAAFREEHEQLFEDCTNIRSKTKAINMLRKKDCLHQ